MRKEETDPGFTALTTRFFDRRAFLLCTEHFLTSLFEPSSDSQGKWGLPFDVLFKFVLFFFLYLPSATADPTRQTVFLRRK